MNISVSLEFSFVTKGLHINPIVPILADLGSILQKRALKGPFTENRAQIGLYLLHSSRPWQLIAVWELPEVTTVFTGLVFHELYEKIIFEF